MTTSTDGILTEEEVILRKTVQDLADRELAPRAAEYDRQEEFPWENIRAISDLGLFGLTIDPEYGGSGGTRSFLEVARPPAPSTVPTSRSALATLTVLAPANRRQGICTNWRRAAELALSP